MTSDLRPARTSSVAAGCCGDARGALDPQEARARATVLKAVADPVRLQLLAQIGAAPGAEACVCDLTAVVGLSQPTVSHHLKVLVDAGLLTRERRGPWAWFALVPERLAQVRAWL